MTLYRDEGLFGTGQFDIEGTESGSSSHLARLSKGGFVLTWTSDQKVHVQVFDVDGNAVGSIFEAPVQDGVQSAPVVTGLADGNFVVAWLFAPADTSASTAIYGQVYTTSGAAASGTFLINQYGERAFTPDLVGLQSGGFVASWSNGDVNGNNDVIAARFTATGGAIGSPFTVNSTTFANQFPSDSATLADGGFAIAWTDGWENDARAQFYNADGTARGGEIVIGSGSSPVLTSLSDGRIAIAWSVGGDLRVQLFDPSGASVSPSIDVTDFADAQSWQSIAALDDGRFVVTFTMPIPGSPASGGGEIFAQQFDSSGAKIGRLLLVNQVVEGAQGNSHVVAFDGDNFAVTWDVTMDGNVIPTFYRGSVAARLFFSPDFVGVEGASGSGSPARDFIYGTAGGDVLSGQGGNDELTGGPGADRLDGGAGFDTVRYDDSDAPVFVNLSTGRGSGNYAEGDTYTSIERVVGSLGNDTLIGGSGEDTLVGALGADTLIGGAGIDTASYDDNAGAVFVNLDLGVGHGNAAEGDTYAGIENVLGSIFDDFIIGEGGSNRLDGGYGNDTLVGSLGADMLIGGPGLDTASFEDNYGSVFVNLGAGRGYNNAAEGDTYQGIENLKGSIYDDWLIGDAGDNKLWGSDGNDVLIGSLGEDILDGGAGSDTASYEDNLGIVDADLERGTGRVYVYIDGVYAGPDGDFLVSIENLTGSQFNDTLKGDAGPNRLDGSWGADYLAGRGGSDVFVFSTTPGPNGKDPVRMEFVGNVDTIGDFVPGTDTIELHASAFTGLAPGALAEGALIYGAAAQDVDDRIVYDLQNRALYFDPDGTGPADQVQFAAFPSNVYPALTASDFVVV